MQQVSLHLIVVPASILILFWDLLQVLRVPRRLRPPRAFDALSVELSRIESCEPDVEVVHSALELENREDKPKTKMGSPCCMLSFCCFLKGYEF